MRQPSSLERQLADTLSARRKKSKLRVLKSSPPGSVDFSSNDFLSLATTPEFRRDYLNELETQNLPVGSTASRLLDGNSEYAETLERRVARFHGAECGLLVNSGFDANVSIFTCLPQVGDVIVYDELIHASVHDGMRMSRAKTRLSFKHNDTDDLKTKLEQCFVTHPTSNVFVSVESVYSMDGDLAPLTAISESMQQVYPDDRCHLIVDEAHSTGVYGQDGRGLVSALGVEDKVLVRLHTFGKAMASHGAIILCSDTIRSYLLNYARPLIFTTFMSYPTLAGIKVAYDWLEHGRINARTTHLFALIAHLHSELKRIALESAHHHQPGTFTVPEQCPESAIFAVLMREPRSMAAHCQNAGFIVRAVVHPTVPLGTERVRICLHAGNTFEQVDGLVTCMEFWLKGRSRTSTADYGRMGDVVLMQGGRAEVLPSKL